MNSFRIILGIVLLMPLLFAASDWRVITGLAIVMSAAILGLLYGIAHAMNADELKFLATEELYQMVATIFMAGIIVGAETSLNEIGNALVNDPFPDKALELLDERKETQETILNDLSALSVGVGREASKSSFCSILGVGMAMNPCGSYRALGAPLAISYQMVGLGAAELNALRTLVDFAKNYAFVMLLPAGIVLRTFRITRGAGGLLMAFALSIYVFVPVSVIGMQDVNDQAADAMEAAGRGVGDMDRPDVPECDATESGDDNYDNVSGFFNDLRDVSRSYTFEFLANATLTTLVALSVMLGSMRSMASLAGADIDVSSLARLA